MQKQVFKSGAILLCVSFIMAALCALLYRFDNKYTYPGDTGRNGIMLQKEFGPGVLPAVFLVRGWEFYQHRLLSPEDFVENPPPPDAYIFIGQYSKFNLGDPSAAPHGSATYRMRISLPETPRSYALELPEIYSSCRIYVNGSLLASRGEIDPSGYRPEIKTGVINFWAGGQSEIIIAVSDYSHFYSGIVYPPAFGLPEAVSAMVGKRLIVRALFCCVALICGLIFIIAGIRQRDSLKTAYGITCTFFMGYTCYPLVHALGWAGSLLWYRVENTCYCLTFLMVLYLQSKLCGIPARVTRCVAIYGGVMCFLAAFSGLFTVSLGAMMLYSNLIRIFKSVVFVYLLATTAYAAKKKALIPQLQLVGITAFGTALMMDRLLPLFEPVISGWFPEFGGSVLIVCLGTDICVRAMRMQREAFALQDQVSLMTEQVSHAGKQLQLQSSRLASLRGDIDDTRRKNHDLRHHVLLLRKLLDTDPKKASAYMEELAASLPSMEDSLCRNIAADCVIRQYVQAAREEGIAVETAVNLPETLGVSDLDLCIILGNMLENALEALLKEPETEERMLRITAGMTGNILSINVDNSIYKPLRYRLGVLQSSKRDAPGVGLSSVGVVAGKYDGNFWWKTVDGMFRASVALKMKEETQVIQYENSSV